VAAVTGTLSGAPGRFARGLRELAPGTWAWLQPDGGLGEANAGLVCGDGASLLVDTLWDRRLARDMLDAMEPHTRGAPIRTVVNTHSDGDHWWGNAEAPADAEIVTSEASARAMRRDVSPRELALLQRLLAVAARLPGTAGAGPRRSRDAFAPFDFGGVRQRRPDRTFSGTTTLDAGGREVRLVEVGPAHSAGDAVVHVPDARVVFAADVLWVGVAPIMWAGPVDNWLRAIDTLLELDAEIYVPGHGDVGTRADVERVGAYWRWLTVRAREQHAAGRGRMDAARAILADDGYARWADWAEAERIVANVDALYRGFGGRDPVGARGPARLAIMRDIAALGAERASPRASA
jgi:cyclase